MKKNFAFLGLCLSLSFGSYAQNIYQTWVFVVENEPGQIEFNQKDKKIIFRRLEDVAAKTFAERRVELEIVEAIQEKNDFRFIVEDKNNNDEIGLIYCFDLGKDRMRMFALQHAKSLEYAKAYQIPKDLGMAGYTWTYTEQILKYKNPQQIGKDETLQVLKYFKAKLQKIDLDDIPEEVKVERELYFSQFLQEALLEKSYNIFVKDVRLGIIAYEEDPEVKKLMDEIKQIVERDAEEESVTEKKDDN